MPMSRKILREIAFCAISTAIFMLMFWAYSTFIGEI